MSKVIVGLFVVGIIVAATAVVVGTNPLLRASFFEPGGMVVSGTKFGISIGDSKISISNSLQKIGLKVDDMAKDRKCVSRIVPGEYALYSYDYSWRRGVICIGIEKNQVKSIGWSFSAFAP